MRASRPIHAVLLGILLFIGPSTARADIGAVNQRGAGSAGLDAYLRGVAAESRHDLSAALDAYAESAEADAEFLAPRLKLARAWCFSDPPRAMEYAHESLSILRRDFAAQRWLSATLVLGASFALGLASLLVMAALLIRHWTALHHALQETLAYLFRRRAGTSILATALLAFPVLANLGPLVTGLFWVFLAAYRFNKGERLVAVGIATVAALLGPLLVFSISLWGFDPLGRDALGIARLQRDAAARGSRIEIVAWSASAPTHGPAVYLEGLASAVNGDASAAAERYRKAMELGHVPPRILETNLGNALAALGSHTEASVHYERAIEQDPRRFEPHYNRALLDAARGEYVGADRALERASRVDLDRLRDLERNLARAVNGQPVHAMFQASDLWDYAMRHRQPVATPRWISWLFPLRSPWLGLPGVLLALIAGSIAGRGLRRLLHVHVCYQCGKPVCRRCLVRLNRRAYCDGCAESLGGRSAEETTRLLLHRLIADRPAWSGQAWRAARSILPGVGPLIEGHAGLALGTSLLFGVASAGFIIASFGPRLLPAPWSDPALDLLRGAGVCFLSTSVAVTALGLRYHRRRASGFRAFLARDVDRLAA